MSIGEYNHAMQHGRGDEENNNGSRAIITRSLAHDKLTPESIENPKQHVICYYVQYHKLLHLAHIALILQNNIVLNLQRNIQIFSKQKAVDIKFT